MPSQELCRSSFLWQWHLSSDWCVLGGRNVDGYSSVHRTWSWRGRAGGVDVGIQAGVVDVVDVNVEALDQQNVAGAWTLSWHSRLLCSRVHQPGVQVGGSGDEPSYDDVDIDNLPFCTFSAGLTATLVLTSTPSAQQMAPGRLIPPVRWGLVDHLGLV